MTAALTLTADDFASALGTTPARLQTHVRDRIQRADLRYETLSREERDAVILGVLNRIDSGELATVGEHRQQVWDRGWAENLEAFAATGFALESLVPRFIHTQPIGRLNQDYVRKLNRAFEFQFHDVVRRWLFLEYMSDADRVCEFGAGSSYNLVAFADLAPDLPLVGLDWAESAVALTDMVGRERHLNLTGRRFDLLQPDPTFDLAGRSAVLTISALEQLGPRHQAFLHYLLEKRPHVCVHLEPLVELYDPASLVDALAIRYHTARGYLTGFLPRLRELESRRRIEILKVQRMRFGSLYHEAYSCVVWRPA